VIRAGAPAIAKIDLPERASVQSMVWYRPSERLWRERYTVNLLLRALDRFADPSDIRARDALSLVLQSWGYDDPRSAVQRLPVLLENRIEILCQAASSVDQI
jgi:hypothetical protein